MLKGDPVFATDLTVLEAAASDSSPVLAVLTTVEKTNYRRPGAMMVFTADGCRIGSLSSGCIEADLAIHAAQCRDEGKVRHVTYGAGSPWIDLRLPCGGTVHIILIPGPSREVLSAICARLRARLPARIGVGGAGQIVLGDEGVSDCLINVELLPDIDFRVFGTGPEALSFSRLVAACGYEVTLASPDADITADAMRHGMKTKRLTSLGKAEIPDCDPWTAIVLFFHDHDWEPVILWSGLGTPAFYLGAQGSRASRQARTDALRRLGARQSDIDRIKGPIGLFASARDARTLAISVLAEVVSDYQRICAARWRTLSG